MPPIDHGRKRLFTALLPPLFAVAVLWLVHLVNVVFHLHLSRFGVQPREWIGLRGILLSPLLHGNLDHLLGNSLPILVLGWLLVYFYPKAAGRVVGLSWVLSGFGVWVVGLHGTTHIGASGVIYGLAGFLFLSGLVRRRIALMAVSSIVIFLYGSMWWGVLPLVPSVSWEGHLFGGLTGLGLALYYRHLPPAHVPPPIVLTDDDDEAPPPDRPVEGTGTAAPGTDPLPSPFLPGYDPRSTSHTG